jgi:hypothetical protein
MRVGKKLPESNPKVISIARGLTVRQADLELAEVLSVTRRKIKDELVQTRAKIRKALEAGAAVEPGTFTARIESDDLWEDKDNELVIERLPSANDQL